MRKRLHYSERVPTAVNSVTGRGSLHAKLERELAARLPQCEVLVRFASGLVARVEASWRHQDVVWDLQASSDTTVVRADLLPTAALECNGEPMPVAGPPTGVDPMVFDLGYVDQMRALAATTAAVITGCTSNAVASRWRAVPRASTSVP